MMLWLLSFVLLASGFFAARIWRRAARRKALLKNPLRQSQRALIAREVPISRRLPDTLRPSYEGKINLFLDQVRFVGCEGLEVTDEMRLSIAAQACLIVANTDAWYERLRTILLYPSAFKSLQTTHDGYVVRRETTVRLGESWSLGPVVLSWHHSQMGAANEHDGQNIVLHEFAHQLDDLSGQTNGVPLFRKGQTFAAWERDFLEAFARHERRVESGKPAVLDPYGATNHQEFFAVTIEAFFEKPTQLFHDEPAIYEQFSQLLGLDPKTW